MNVAIVNLATGQSHTMAPLGALYIVASLEQAGASVTFKDYALERGPDLFSCGRDRPLLPGRRGRRRAARRVVLRRNAAVRGRGVRPDSPSSSRPPHRPRRARSECHARRHPRCVPLDSTSSRSAKEKRRRSSSSTRWPPPRSPRATRRSAGLKAWPGAMAPDAPSSTRRGSDAAISTTFPSPPITTCASTPTTSSAS